jgi:transcriptional regulator with XRE-family HTH domain
MSTDTARTIARARTLSSLSQRQLALAAGVSSSTVSRLERGDLDPTVGVFEKLLGACGFRYGTGPNNIRSSVRRLPLVAPTSAVRRRWGEG